jgi:hypothetical protein
MKINKVARNKVEVIESGKRVEVEVSRVGKNILVTLNDGERSVDMVVKNVANTKFINVLRRFGINDVQRVVAYIESMTSVKMIEARKAIFMSVETVENLETGGVVDRIIETYYHTADDSWRVFSAGQVREVYNIATPIKNINELFMHYNTADVNPNVVTEMSNIAEEVKEVLSQYVVLDEKYYDVAASWIIATYTRWASPYAELLIIRKPGFGTGGSTLLKTVWLLSARPIKLVLDTSPAGYYRAVNFAMPTIARDEIREDEMPREKLSEFKLLAEGSFDREYVVLRVIDGELTAFSTYANVAIVDTTDKFTTYSAERRAWTVVIRQAVPNKLYDTEEILSATASLREKLYSLGIVLPTMYYDQWKKIAKEQGLGVLRFLARASKALSGDASIFESALETVSKQLEYAKQTAVLTDPKHVIADALIKIINDARRELIIAANSNTPWEHINIITPLDKEFKCGYIYLEKIIRELRRRSMEVVQVDAKKLDSIQYTTSEIRYWFRVNKDVEIYLKPAKIKAILMELGIELKLDENRHYYVEICRGS